jgi:hypothetical protein
MSDSRYAVPLEQLEGPRERECLVVEPEPSHPDATAWAGAQLPPFLDGAAGVDTD